MLLGAAAFAACSGQVNSSKNNPSGSGGNTSSTGGSNVVGGGTGGSNVDPGKVTVPPATFVAAVAGPTCRKLKDLIIGMPCTDDEVSTVQKSGPAGLQQLIIGWMTGSNLPLFKAKMVPFFRNMFQQVGFTPTQDFKNQLLQNGGFDFGPLGTAAVGDDVYAKLVQNLQDSFALTAWQMVQEGTEPFSDVLTTTKFYMTTGLMSLYTQIEMPDDEPYNFSGGFNQTPKLAWKLDYVNTIPLTDSLNSSSPNYMIFDDEKPASSNTRGFLTPTCQGTGDAASGTTQTVVQFGGTSSGSNSFQRPTGGYAQLFQRLIGYTPRYPFLGQPECWEHPSKPYMTDADVSDWRWVTIVPKQSGDSYIQPYDLPSLEKASSIKLAMPRIGFYTTPAFLALWNTNDSNQHRVTMNQTLLASLGVSFTSDNDLTPLSEVGLASSHTTTSGECYGCHKSLDPMRLFFANQYDFNDRNDFVANPFTGSQPNPRPASPLQGAFTFANVNWASPSSGTSMADLGPLLLKVTDGSSDALPMFAISVAQQLCFWANSQACSTDDTVFRGVVKDFVSSNYNFPALVKELFSSALMTGAAATSTFPADSAGNETVPISISRQTHFCGALSARLGVTDICALGAAIPTSAQNTTLTIAGSVAQDAFSRGSQTPVTPSYPDMFYRAATEELCENIANQAIDVTGSPFTSSSTSCANGDGLLTKFVEQVMGLNPSDSAHDQALMILETHCATASKTKSTTGGGFGGGTSASGQTTGVRSTFVLACESPTALGIGL
jgi:hypothetical protein